MGARGALLDPADVQGRSAEIHLIRAQVHQFRDTQPVPVSQEDHRGVPVAPTIAVGGSRQAFHFGLGEILAGAQVGVGHTLGGDCAIYGGWRDQLEVRLGRRFCLSRATTVRTRPL
jgi:hypothetical protein